MRGHESTQSELEDYTQDPDYSPSTLEYDGSEDYTQDWHASRMRSSSQDMPDDHRDCGGKLFSLQSMPSPIAAITANPRDS